MPRAYVWLVPMLLCACDPASDTVDGSVVIDADAGRSEHDAGRTGDDPDADGSPIGPIDAAAAGDGGGPISSPDSGATSDLDGGRGEDDAGAGPPGPGCSPGGSAPYAGMSEPEVVGTGSTVVAIGVGCSGRPWIVRGDDLGPGDLVASRWSPSGWVDETVVDDASGGPIDLAVSSDDTAHVVYQTWPSSVRYARSGDWTPTTIDSIGEPGSSLGIALTSAGEPWIVYESGPAALHAYRRAGVWRTEVALSRTDEGIGAVAISVDAADRLSIFASLAGWSGGWELYVVHPSTGSWTESVIFTGTVRTPFECVGRHIRAVAGVAGETHIALKSDNRYSEDSSGYEGGGYYASTDGTTLTAPELFTGPYARIAGTDVAIDAEGDPHLLFVGADVVYATRRAGRWETRTIDTIYRASSFDAASAGAIAVDPFGGVHIAYARDGAFSDPPEIVYVRLID